MEYDFTHKLLSAASKGHTNGAAMLIEHGVDVNLKDNDGMTALMWAAREGHIDTVAMLIDKGADVNAKDNKGFAALTWAAMFSRTDIEALLIDKGADVNAKEVNGMTDLMNAAKYGHTDMAAMLSDKGADINNSIKQEKFRKLSIAALITGILGYIFSIIFIVNWYYAFADMRYRGFMWASILNDASFIFVICLPIIAIICGSIDLKRIKAGRYSNKGIGLDIAGIVLGSFFILMIILLFFFIIAPFFLIGTAI